MLLREKFFDQMYYEALVILSMVSKSRVVLIEMVFLHIDRCGLLSWNEETQCLGGGGVFATKHIAMSDVLVEFHGQVTDRQDQHVLSIGQHHYLRDTPRELSYFINHSHIPNAWIAYSPRGFPQLRALREIRSGEEITFDYNTSDWDLGEFGFWLS